MDQSDDWLSTLDVARALGMSDEWVRVQIHAARLSARRYNAGGRPTWRIRRADLEAFLADYAMEYRAAQRRKLQAK